MYVYNYIYTLYIYSYLGLTSTIMGYPSPWLMSTLDFQFEDPGLLIIEGYHFGELIIVHHHLWNWHLKGRFWGGFTCIFVDDITILGFPRSLFKQGE